MKTSRRLCIFCGNIVCRHMTVEEAGKRMSDTINNVRMSNDWDDIKNGWMAFALEDGRSNGTIYDSRADAVRLLSNASKKHFFCALRSCMHGCTPKEATLILAMARTQAERGRYNPQRGHDPIAPLTKEDYTNELLSTKLNKPYIIPGL